MCVIRILVVPSGLEACLFLFLDDLVSNECAIEQQIVGDSQCSGNIKRIVVLGNSIYESSATGPAGFSDPAHPACEVLRP